MLPLIIIVPPFTVTTVLALCLTIQASIGDSRDNGATEIVLEATIFHAAIIAGKQRHATTRNKDAECMDKKKKLHELGAGMV